MTVWIYVDPHKGRWRSRAFPGFRFARRSRRRGFKEHDSEGVAFEYEVIGT